MENKEKNLHTFVKSLLSIFAYIVLFQMVVGYFVGDDAQHISTLFRMGSNGIAYTTLLQTLVFALYVTIVQQFMSINFFKKRMRLLWRLSLTLLMVALGCFFLSLMFGWFSVKDGESIAMYVLTFLLSAGGCILIMVLKTRKESIEANKKLQELKNQTKKMD